jgi:alkylhydroperoxidase family enzyme
MSSSESFELSSHSREANSMEQFPIYTIDSAPTASKSALQDVQARFGAIPNLAGAMALSPVLLKSFVPIFDQVHGGSFSEQQIQAVLLTDAVTNGSTWAVALHTALGLKAGLSAPDVAAIRDGRSPPDGKLGALSTLARTMIEKRGRLDDLDIGHFLKAGFSKELLLEVITIVAASTITNYTGSITKPLLEDWLRLHAWKG